MPGYVGEGPARLCSQIFDATVARREMFGQLKAMRVTERLPDLRELAKFRTQAQDLTRFVCPKFAKRARRRNLMSRHQYQRH